MIKKDRTDESHLLQETNSTNYMMLAVTGIGATIAVLVILLYHHHFGSIEENHERWGQFGDYFGGVLNPIFSFLGLVAIVMTLRLQTSQLRQNTLDTQKQNDRTDLMQFQATFFQLLELHNKIVSDAVITNGLGTNFYARDVYKLLQARINSIRHFDQNNRSTSASEIYSMVYLKSEDLLAHYFRNLYHIIKFIDTSRVEDKQYYADILRAQLSASESALLFYNGLSKWGLKRAKPLIEKYCLLKTLPSNIDLPEELISEYNRNAFRGDFFANRASAFDNKN